MKDVFIIGLALFGTIMIGLTGLTSLLFSGMLLFSPFFRKNKDKEEFSKQEEEEYDFYRIFLGVAVGIIGIVAVIIAGKICLNIVVPLLRGS